MVGYGYGNVYVGSSIILSFAYDYLNHDYMKNLISRVSKVTLSNGL